MVAVVRAEVVVQVRKSVAEQPAAMADVTQRLGALLASCFGYLRAILLTCA